MIRLLLNDKVEEVDRLAPTASVLDYVRTIKALTGTKEGCAAGDCGACTVVIGALELDSNGVAALTYCAINACITPLASLHGKQLLTVEHLSSNGDLHPIQQAMVDHHGSQCGFCTPGVVMSLFAWWHSRFNGNLSGDRQALELALSGNLCRCTGYQPIFAAAQQASLAEYVDFLTAQSDRVTRALADLRVQGGGHLSSGAGDFFIPRSIAELCQLLRDYPDARLVGGATDIGLEFTQQLHYPQVLIYTGNVKALNEWHEEADALRIGASVSYRRLLPTVTRYWPDFAALLLRLGSVQIRNQGSLGGNVANGSPIGDCPPVLLALNATLHLNSHLGPRSLAIADFFLGYRQTALGPSEFIEAIELPKLGAGELLKVYKISKRFDDDIAAVSMALWLAFDNDLVSAVRIGFGGMAAVPARAKGAEQALLGRPFDEAAVSAAQACLATDFSPIDDVRASAAYRLAVAANLLTRARLELEGGASLSVLEQRHSGGGFYRA